MVREPDAQWRTCVITVGGWGAGRMGPNNMLADLCRLATENGCASLDFDLSGRGDAEGDPALVTVDDMMDDTIRACRLMKGRGAAAIVLVGLCSGGNVALGSAACGAPVDAVVAISTLPYIPIADKSAARAKTAGHLRGYFLKLFRAETYSKLFRGAVSFKGVWRTLTGKGAGAGKASDRSLKDTRRDILGLLPGFKGPVVHIYGSADPESAPSRKYFEEHYLRVGRKVAFHELQGANHNFYGLTWRADISRVVFYTADCLNPSSAPTK